MADERKDEAKAPHWTSAQLTEASAHPHPPEIKDQGGAGEGLVRSANGFPYQEDEEGAFGEHGSQATYSNTKENGINGELTSADRETAGNRGFFCSMLWSHFGVKVDSFSGLISFTSDRTGFKSGEGNRHQKAKKL